MRSVSQPTGRRTGNQVDWQVLTSLAKGHKTLYGITKNTSPRLGPSNVNQSLKRLRDSNHIRVDGSSKWRTGLERREWVLTVKGWVRLLREAHQQLDHTKDREHRIEVTNTVKEAIEKYKPDDDRPLFPILHSRPFQERLGDKDYLDVLMVAAMMAYITHVERHERIMRPHWKGREGRRQRDLLRKYQTTQQYKDTEEQQLADTFEMSFLHDLRITDSNMVPIPNEKLRNHVKALLDSRIKELEKEIDAGRVTLRWVTRVFDPGVSAKAVEEMKRASLSMPKPRYVKR